MQKIDMTKLLPFYDTIAQRCVAAYQAETAPTPFALLEELMDLPGLPMHCPPHHYIIPALLLTVVGREAQVPEDLFREQLAEAKERALNVLGGFCGWYGSCGAAVGIGIFLSIFTDTNPHSKDNWAACNGATGQALLKIAQVEGPRCCKRNCFMALFSALETIRAELGIGLPVPAGWTCNYHENNPDCKLQACPYYPVEE